MKAKSQKKQIKLSARGYLLAIKYWLQGDSWQFAKEYAAAITQGFKGN
jgi:hypothetical protein